MFTGGAKSRSRYRSGLDVYIPARDKGPITDYPQTRFKFISRPERRSLPDKMWGRPGKRGHIYFVSPRLTPPRPLSRSGNVPKWQNICPGSLPVCSDLRTLATPKSGLTFKLDLIKATEFCKKKVWNKPIMLVILSTSKASNLHFQATFVTSYGYSFQELYLSYLMS